jgi:hypothetical protein
MVAWGQAARPFWMGCPDAARVSKYLHAPAPRTPRPISSGAIKTFGQVSAGGDAHHNGEHFRISAGWRQKLSISNPRQPTSQPGWMLATLEHRLRAHY